MNISKTSLSYRFWQFGLARKYPIFRLYGVGSYKNKVPTNLCQYINKLFMYAIQLLLVYTVLGIVAYTTVLSPIDAVICMIQQSKFALNLVTHLPYAGFFTFLTLCLAALVAFILGVIWLLSVINEVYNECKRKRRLTYTYVEKPPRQPSVIIAYVKAWHEGICKDLDFVEDVVVDKPKPTTQPLLHVKVGSADEQIHATSVAEFKALDLTKHS